MPASVRQNLLNQHNLVLQSIIGNLKEELGSLGGHLLNLLECEVITKNNLVARGLVVDFLIAHHISVRGLSDHASKLSIDRLALDSISSLKETQDNSEDHPRDPLS